MIQPIILAAGKGMRMESSLPKALHKVRGKTMLERVFQAVHNTKNCKPPLVVVGHGAEEIRARLGPAYQYILQTEITGTASAVLACVPYITEDTRSILILYGDHPLISSGVIGQMVGIFEKEKPILALFTATIPDFLDWRAGFLYFGRVARDINGNVEKIVEYKEVTESERAIREINPAIYCVEKEWLMTTLSRITPSRATGEYYLTDIVALAHGDGVKIITVPMPPEEALGVNTREDIARAELFFTPPQEI